MSGCNNQKVKLLGIAKILRNFTDSRHGITIDELAYKLQELYGVKAERKSLYNDLKKLEALGYDISKLKKDRKYYYKLLSREFEVAELKILVDSVQFSKFITPNKKKQLLKKLLALTSNHGAKELKEQIHLKEMPRSRTNRQNDKWNEKIYYNVDRLYRAINKKQKVTFQYIYWNINQKKEYKHGGEYYILNPFYLVEKHEKYYLIAYDELSDKIKHYRVDKMENVRESSEHRVGESVFANIDINSYCQKRFSMFGGEEKSVTLRLKNSLLGVAIDKFGHKLKIKRADEENFELTINVVNSGQFYGWIFANKGKIQIIEPNDVKEEFYNYLEKLKNQYLVSCENEGKIIKNKDKIKEGIIKEEKQKQIVRLLEEIKEKQRIREFVKNEINKKLAIICIQAGIKQ